MTVQAATTDQLMFGSRAVAPASNDASNKPKAKYWINLGYKVAEPTDEDKDAYRFVSLPVGIALDTMKRIGEEDPSNPKKQGISRNAEFAKFQVAQNDLLDDLIKVGESLQPGQDVIFECSNGLAIQIRRVNDEVQAPAADAATNQFVAAKPKLFG